jgi:hypothetical protein
MSDAAIFTPDKQDDLDHEDPVMGLWRLENDARARRGKLKEAGAAGAAGAYADHPRGVGIAPSPAAYTVSSSPLIAHSYSSPWCR